MLFIWSPTGKEWVYVGCVQEIFSYPNDMNIWVVGQQWTPGGEAVVSLDPNNIAGPIWALACPD